MKKNGSNSGKVASKWPPKTPFLDRFSKIFKKFSKIFLASSRHFWCLQMPYFGNFCTTPSLAAGPVWNSPYIFFGQISNPPKPPWGGWGGRNILGGQQPHLYLSDDTCFVSIRNFATSAISTVTRAVTVKPWLNRKSIEHGPSQRKNCLNWSSILRARAC